MPRDRWHGETNHIWLNAFSIIKPSDQMLMDIGRTVVEMLRQKDNLIPARADHESDMAKLTPKLYMSINAS